MHIAILGNGITGVSAAIRLRELRPDWSITMISGESTYHYSRPALMYIYMGHMGYAETKPYEDSFWGQQRIDLVRGWVTAVDTDARRLELADGRELEYDQLLLATGAKPNKFGWPGQDLEGVQGFYSLMDLERLYRSSEGARRGVVVGGGLIGLELAEMLHSRGIAVTLLVREDSYWNNVLPDEESAMVTELIRAAGMDLRLGVELKEVLDDGTGRATAVVTSEGQRIDCQVVGLTAGVSPNKALAEAVGVPCGRGVLTDSSLRAKVPGVWAAGDCAELETPGEERNMIQQVWYTGKAQGRLAAEAMHAEAEGHALPTYDPGIWFNSAKFLDLEYQTYGQVGFHLPGEQHLVWQAPGKLLRIVHIDGRVVGFNAMGLRWRHLVCEDWIREARNVDFVLAHLEDAGFDPEFYSRHEPEMRRTFADQLAKQTEPALSGQEA
ncbi:MAG: NAD(P)/FAD-dependent oxidoreductase [Planctomycetota bacterium]|nr:NAD(P)/FAD-dependent oxidoreductase [Planctomycetota bacterium]